MGLLILVRHPALALRIIDRDAPLATFNFHDEVNNSPVSATVITNTAGMLSWPVLTSSRVPAIGARQPRNNAGEDNQRNTITHATFGDLLAQPHQKYGSGRQCYHGGKQETEAPGAYTTEDCDCSAMATLPAWKRRQYDGERCACTG